MDARVLEIERCALAGWPAAEVAHFEGWRLRAMAGLTRRANSAWTSWARGRRSLPERIAYVESFYRARGLPAAFHITPIARPPGLDAMLASRAYAIEGSVLVQVARCEVVARGPRPLEVSVTDRLSEDWFGVSAQGRFAAMPGDYRALLARLGVRARFALARSDGRPVAVGLGVMGRRWLGISSMLTLPEYRGRGAARSILSALAAESVRSGLAAVYLQVEEDNTRARDVYRAAGFVEHHPYHYRVQPVGQR